MQSQRKAGPFSMQTGEHTVLVYICREKTAVFRLYIIPQTGCIRADIPLSAIFDNKDNFSIAVRTCWKICPLLRVPQYKSHDLPASADLVGGESGFTGAAGNTPFNRPGCRRPVSCGNRNICKFRRTGEDAQGTLLPFSPCISYSGLPLSIQR